MKDLIKKVKRKKSSDILFVVCMIAIALVFRSFLLNKYLFFGYEQARDLFEVEKILGGDLKLLGPPTDIAGIYHGVIYLYILLPFYFIFDGDPYKIEMCLIAINSLSVLFLYLAVKNHFNEKIARLSTVLYVVNYSSIVYARWLSNTTLIPACAILLYYFLVKSKTNWKYLFGVVIFWGLILNFHEVVGMSLLPGIVGFICVEKIKLRLKQVLAISLSVPCVFTTYGIYEIKNDFLMTKALLGYFSGGGVGSTGLSSFYTFIEEVADNIYTLSPRFSFLVIVVTVVVFSRKYLINRHVLATLFLSLSPLVFFLCFGIVPLRHFFITIPVFLPVLIALLVWNMDKNKINLKLFPVYVLVIVCSVWVYKNNILANKPTFIYNAQRTYLGDLKNVIDWTYINSNGNYFSYNYYSVPYWKEEMWEYMFRWYGKNTHGRLPVREKTDVYFTLIEPNLFIPVHQDNWYGEYKKDSELIDTYQSGQLEVEMRRAKKTI
ncbi:glycosyltransferase family 39 protein [Candidatus Woesebacteria bacterium]|nr:MAG: glycosyltransferase family 39 protein [Candidatus Woesebacteria bacterium]